MPVDEKEPDAPVGVSCRGQTSQQKRTITADDEWNVAAADRPDDLGRTAPTISVRLTGAMMPLAGSRWDSSPAKRYRRSRERRRHAEALRSIRRRRAAGARASP